MSHTPDTTGLHRFPHDLGLWVAKNYRLLDALAALRDLGEEGQEALGATQTIHRVAILDLSWRLWTELTQQGGGDPEIELERVLPRILLDRVRAALWGPGPWPGCEAFSTVR